MSNGAWPKSLLVSMILQVVDGDCAIVPSGNDEEAKPSSNKVLFCTWLNCEYIVGVQHSSRGDYHGPTVKHCYTDCYSEYISTTYYQLCTSGYLVEEGMGGDTWQERGETMRRRRRAKQKLQYY